MLALLAAVPWLVRSLHTRPAPDAAAPRPRWRTAWRSKVAWALAVCFAAQSVAAYVGFGWLAVVLRDGGVDSGRAALMVAVWSLLGVPVGLLVPAPAAAPAVSGPDPLAVGRDERRGLARAGARARCRCLACGRSCWASAAAPSPGPWPWWALHGRSVADTAVLSGFVQSVGYLLAAAGPFSFGALHGLTGSWTPSLVGMAAVATVMGVAGALVLRSPRYGS